MILLDTNIFIYLAKGTLAPSVLSQKIISHASITRIEALGFQQISAHELQLFTALFDESYELPLSEAVVARTIQLKQRRTMSVGDAIIAATALEKGLELWTANTSDFTGISGLRVVNPLVK